MNRLLLYATIGLTLLTLKCFSQEEDKIIETAKDYFEGWYDGDTVRMSKALHPELRKTIMFETESGESSLYHTNKDQMMEYTEAGYGKKESRDSLNHSYKILDIYNQTIAVVRAESFQFVDYLHLIKYNGEWKLLSVLWKNKN